MEDEILKSIEKRYSCRRYREQPLERHHRIALERFLASHVRGPLGSELRLELLAATEEDRSSLKGLGTYGFIRGAAAFMAGAVRSSANDLEDYGYVMEHAVLLATGLGLGTCWLGGTFTKSGFARRIGLTAEEGMPAVVAVGHKAQEDLIRTQLRRRVGATERLPAERLFFDGSFDRPIRLEPGEPLARILEAVRWAPSASNKQPWRILRTGDRFLFFLQRTKGYGKGSLLFRLLGLADLQRVDMGIAMCHFELIAAEMGLEGRWNIEKPNITGAPRRMEYIATWRLESPGKHQLFNSSHMAQARGHSLETEEGGGGHDGV